jgi:putative membrane protein
MLPSVSDLPLVNASLNGIATVLLVVGYVCIRRRRIAAHRAAMVAAFSTSVLFLISYLIYHAHAGSKPFPGQGPIRVVYFSILVTHIVLAATIPPLAGVTLWRAYRRRFDRHMRIARWTLPLWLYVSITGIIVYLMLYQLY